MSKNKGSKSHHSAPKQTQTQTQTPHSSHSTASATPAKAVGPCWRISALDTWFFRESRPMESIGGAQLQSVFPPPVRTLIGAVRTAIAESCGVNWHDYPNRPEHQSVRELIGQSDDLGCLSFQGPYLFRKEQCLFPAPLVLLKANEQFTRLAPSDKLTESDLGRVALPNKKNAQLLGAKPLEQIWLTPEGWQATLRGDTPRADHMVPIDDLLDKEERLGIGRNHATRTTGDGLLYQTQHIRPKADIAIGLHVNGLDAQTPLPASGLVRLGAEGRLAHWQRSALPTLPPPPAINSQRLLVVLVTHARFERGWLPDGFEPATVAHRSGKDQTVWRGQINGVALRLISAVVGKPVREGGWDLLSQAPRPMHALVPAASCYFFEVEDAQANAVQALHGSQIGQDTALGRGQIAIGNW
jgi:CRISPR-associated protein Cmr3